MGERWKIPERLSTWAQCVRRRKDKPLRLEQPSSSHKSLNLPSELPYLPAERPSNLTPSSSQESLVLSGSSDCAFFQRLPFEIRRLILIEAFGNYILHMDLIYGYPIPPHSERMRDPKLVPRHAQLTWPKPAPEPEPSRFGKRKPKQVEQWTWQGCVCHDFPFGICNNGPWNDNCRIGIIGPGPWTFEELEKGECDPSLDRSRRSSCLLSIIGWLLSCRQAYGETIDLLYSTNTLCMSNNFVILNLPRLLLPHRLATIRSVEIKWEVHPFRPDKPDDPPSSDLAAFQAFLEFVPATFPSLRELFLSIQGDMKGSRHVYLMSESAIMEPLDDLVRSLAPRLETCEIAVPTSLYRERKHEMTGKSFRPRLYGEKRKAPGRERFWRQLPRIETQTGNDVGPPAPAHLKGYWLHHGQFDMMDEWSRGMVCTAIVSSSPEPEPEPEPQSDPDEPPETESQARGLPF